MRRRLASNGFQYGIEDSLNGPFPCDCNVLGR
jgi:hypothetical protein